MAALNMSAVNFVIASRRNFPVFVFGNDSVKYTPPRNLNRSENFSEIKKKDSMQKSLKF